MKCSTKVILLVEDNPGDEIPTLRASKADKIANAVVVDRDGAEAPDYLFGTGVRAGRDISVAVRRPGMHWPVLDSAAAS